MKYLEHKKGLGFAVKLNLLVFIIVLVSMGSLFFVINKFISNDIFTLKSEAMFDQVVSLKKIMDDKMLDIDNEFDNFNSAEDLARYLKDSRELDDLVKKLDIIRITYSFIEEIMFSDDKGNIIYSNLQQRVNTNISDTQYFKNSSLQRNEQYAMESDTSHLPVLYFYRNIKSEDQAYKFIFVVNLYNFFNYYLKDIDLGKTGYFLVVDKNGLVYYHKDKSQVLNNIGKDLFFVNLVAKSGKSQAKENRIMQFKMNNQEKTLVFADLSKFNFFVSEIINYSEIMEIAKRLQLELIIGSLVLIVLVVGIIFLILNKNVLGKIKQLVYSIEAASTGDLKNMIDLHSGDEIGNIIFKYNYLLQTLNQLIGNTKNAMENLSSTGDDLSVNMEETAAAVNQINANIIHSKKQIDDQAANVTQTTASVEEMTRSIESLNTILEDLSASITESSTAVEQMISNIQSVSNSSVQAGESVSELSVLAKDGKMKLLDVNGMINSIAKQSEKLLEANKIISGIASKTNLLAMNAAIEAAHAGDAGKGFAVVADEIRKLAEMSSSQSKDIEKNLNDIKGNIDQVVISSKQVTLSFDKVVQNVSDVDHIVHEVKQAMLEQNEGGTQVLDALKKMNEISSTVRTSGYEMGEGTKQIMDAVKKLNNLTFEVKASTDEINKGINEINKAVNNVSQMTQMNKQSIDQVKKDLVFFKILDLNKNSESAESRAIESLQDQEIRQVTLKDEEFTDTP